MLSGAECSTSHNTLSQFLKHTQTDRSLQQDRQMGGTAGAAQGGFRTRPGPGGVAGAQDMDAFMRQREMGAPPSFDMRSMHAEMDAMRGASAAPPATRSAAARPPSAGQAWAQEMQHAAPSGGATAWRPPRADAAGAPAYMPREPVGWSGRSMYAPRGAGMMMGARPPPMAMQRPAAPAEGLNAVSDATWDEHFRQHEEAANLAAKGKAKEDEQPDAAALNEIEEMRARLHDEVQDDNPRFEELWQALKDPSVLENSDELAQWEQKLVEAIAAEDPVNSTHPGGGLGPGALGLSELDGLGEEEARLRHELTDVDDGGFPMLGSYQFDAQNPYAQHAAPYAEGVRLLENNGSLTDAALLFEAAAQRDQEAPADELDLSRAERSRAWQRLGECHAMNEHEEKAIQALEEALRIDPMNLSAHMSLAVSYINEGYDQAANATLLKYLAWSHPHIAPSSEFPTLPDETTNPWARLSYVRERFLLAAREDAARQRMDPDIQVGLGLLFYSTSSYDQARDCFQAALESRPNDCQLWNRLGATLANGGSPELATEAYHKALELRPTFTRAVYNLSVSCLNLGAHHEAAEHLLSALTLQRAQPVPDAPDAKQAPLAYAQESEGLWSSLRSIMVMMNRMDLANQCHIGADLAPFRDAGFEC